MIKLFRGVLVGILAAAGAASAAASDAAISVVDGDTVQIGGGIFPLYGADAPELGQLCIDDGKWNRCGITAAFELRKLLKFDEPLNCEQAVHDPSRYICLAARADVALVLLRGGYAAAAPGSGPAYREAERQARDGNLGLWHMTFVPPWDWRAGKRLPGEDEAGVGRCPVKAVIDPQGLKIYYVPTDGIFKDIRIDPAAGERLFCSVAAAEAAGWRRPGGS